MLVSHTLLSSDLSISFNEGILIEKAVKPLKAVGGMDNPCKTLAMNSLHKVPEKKNKFPKIDYFLLCLKCQFN